jgi:hypothetical protein
MYVLPCSILFKFKTLEFQFIRLLGGTLSLAVASTLLNNKLRTSMTSLDISSSQINQIIDNPALLHTPPSVGIFQDTATYILYHGYMKGLSSLFILDACLTAFATLVSVVMIKHKELTHEDDEMLRQQAIRELEKKMTTGSGAATPKKKRGTVPPPKDLESGVAAAAEDVKETEKENAV